MKPPTIGFLQTAPLLAVLAFCVLAWIIDWVGLGSSIFMKVAAVGALSALVAVMLISFVTSIRYYRYRRWLRARRAGGNG